MDVEVVSRREFLQRTRESPVVFASFEFVFPAIQVLALQPDVKVHDVVQQREVRQQPVAFQRGDPPFAQVVGQFRLVDFQCAGDLLVFVQRLFVGVAIVFLPLKFVECAVQGVDAAQQLLPCFLPARHHRVYLGRQPLLRPRPQTILSFFIGETTKAGDEAFHQFVQRSWVVIDEVVDPLNGGGIAVEHVADVSHRSEFQVVHDAREQLTLQDFRGAQESCGWLHGSRDHGQWVVKFG